MQNLLKNKSLLWSMLGVVVLAIGVIVALQLLPQEQDTRRDAASDLPQATAQIKMDPTTLTLAPNEKKEVSVTFNSATTDGDPNDINGIVAVIKYTFTGSQPPVTASNIKLQTPFSRTDTWSCANSRVNTVGQEVRIEVACRVVNPGDAFTTNNTFQPFFTFELTGVSPTQQAIILNFDPVETSITRVMQSGQQGTPEIAAIPQTRLTVNVRATASPSPSPRVSPSPSPRVSPSPSPSASPQTSPSPSPTSSPGTGGTGAVKRILLSTDGLKCGDSSFTITATVKDGGNNMQDVTVKFKYNNTEKTGITASNGQASATFNKASNDQWVNAEADGYEHGSLEIKQPTGCSSTAGAACNAACTASRDCANGRTCVNGLCRDSRCTNDATCACGDTDPAAENGDSELPESGFDQTMAFTLLGLLFILGGGQLLWSFTSAHKNPEQE